MQGEIKSLVLDMLSFKLPRHPSRDVKKGRRYIGLGCRKEVLAEIPIWEFLAYR